jgi:CBS-domain-containing membrane protein
MKWAKPDMPIVIGLIFGAVLGAIAATGAVKFVTSGPPTLPAASAPMPDTSATRTIDV